MAPATMAGRILFAVVLCGLIPVTLGGQVSFERLRDAAVEPHNWLTYSGGYFSQRYSELDQITPENVDHLRLQWVYQTPIAGTWQSTPLVVDGVMYRRSAPTTSSRSMRERAESFGSTATRHHPGTGPAAERTIVG